MDLIAKMIRGVVGDALSKVASEDAWILGFPEQKSLKVLELSTDNRRLSYHLVLIQSDK